MNLHTKHFLKDALVLTVSIVFAVYLVKTGTVYSIIAALGELKYIGIFIAGMFFTSVFTTAPSIVVLGEFAHSVPLWQLALVGGAGAVVGDYIIFRFMKGHVSKDIEFLLSVQKRNRLKHIFKTKLFRYFVPFIGALIIASPFPDEIGITLLGLSKMDEKVFFPISFTFNALGIVVIGLLAQTFS
jgi:hypothetical protein